MVYFSMDILSGVALELYFRESKKYDSVAFFGAGFSGGCDGWRWWWNNDMGLGVRGVNGMKGNCVKYQWGGSKGEGIKRHVEASVSS